MKVQLVEYIGVSILFFFQVVLLPDHQLFAQQGTGFELVGRWPYGSSRAVEVNDNNVFLGNGGAIEILDISDLNTLQKVFTISTNGMVHKIVNKNEYLYVACGFDGLRIFDVSSSEQPILVGHYQNNFEFLDIAIKNDIAYLAASDSGLLTLDISQKSNPFFVNQIADIGEVEALFVIDTLAYVAAGDSGMKIIKITNVDSLEILGTYQVDNPTPQYSSYCNGLYVEDKYAYILVSSMGMQIVDVSNPKYPFEVENIALPHDLSNSGTGLDIFIDNGYAYIGFISDNTAGTYLIDIRNPENPIGYNFYQEGIAYDGLVKDSLCFLASDNQGLQIININSLPESFSIVNQWESKDESRDLVVDNESIYIAGNGSGLLHLEYDGLNNLNLKNQYSMQRFWAQRVNVSDSLIYVISSYDSLYIFENREPEGLKIIGSGHFSGISYHNEFLVQGEFAYLLRNGSYSISMSIVNISKPDSIYIVGEYEIYSSEFSHDLNRSIVVSDNKGFITAGNKGIRIIDLTDKSNPVEIGQLVSEKRYTDLVLLDHFLFVSEAYGFAIIDISDCTAPKIISEIEIDGYCNNIAINGYYAYVSIFYDGILMIDISDKERPFIVEEFETSGIVRSIRTNDNEIYIADGADGIYVLQNKYLNNIGKEIIFSNPAAFKLYQNYPNPFNPSTNIKFYVHHKSLVTIIVYDVQGRKVKTLCNDVKSSGNYSIPWDGSDLSSGVYFVELTSGSYSKVIKTLLLK